MYIQRKKIAAFISVLVFLSVGPYVFGKDDRPKNKYSPVTRRSFIAAEAVGKKFPYFKHLLLFADHDTKVKLNKHDMFYVSTLDIYPKPPFYYVSVNKMTNAAHIVNMVDLSEFNAFAVAEGFDFSKKSERKRFIKAFLRYHVTRDGDLVERMTPAFKKILVKRGIKDIPKRAVIFYPRKEGGGRLLFFSMVPGKSLVKWDLSLSSKGKVLAVRRKKIF